MYNFYKKEIYIYEKKISLEHAYRLYKDKRLIFPELPYTSKERKVQKLSITVETILLGVALSSIYVSEQQGGELLVLDVSDKLLLLFEFMDQKYRLGYMELYPELNGLYFEELERQYPKVTTLLFDNNLSIQVIDYATQKYLHLLVGKHMEKWNFSREQGFLNVLYSGSFVNTLEYLAFEVRGFRKLFSTISLNRQYSILRLFLYDMIARGKINVGTAGQSGLQILLEQGIEIINSWDRNELLKNEEYFLNTISVVNDWVDSLDYPMWEGRGKELQVRNLCCLYMLVNYTKYAKHRPEYYLDKFAKDYRLAVIVKKSAVTFDTIDEHLRLLEEGVARYDSEY